MSGPKTSQQRPKLRKAAKETKGDSTQRRQYHLAKSRSKLTRLLNKAIKNGRTKKAEALRRALGTVA